MFCDEALEAIEPIAAGELTAEGRIADHLRSCPNCAAALEEARRLERLLQARAVASAPPPFTARMMTRIRRERWRREQVLDVGFNLAIGAIGLAMIAGVWMALSRSGLAAVSNDAVDLVGTGLVALARRVAPAVPLYAAATALLVSAIGIWWWAERDAGL